MAAEEKRVAIWPFLPSVRPSFSFLGLFTFAFFREEEEGGIRLKAGWKVDLTSTGLAALHGGGLSTRKRKSMTEKIHSCFINQHTHESSILRKVESRLGNIK